MKKISYKKRLLAISAASVLASLFNTASASAFQLWEQDESDLGNYHAGSAATADNAATEYTNPAGMVRLKHPELSVGGVMATPDIEFNGTVNGETVNNAQGGSSAFIPNLHFVMPLTDRLAAGFGVTVPFGAQSDYGGDDGVSNATTLTSIKTINIGPNLAYAVTDKFSVGAGFDAQNLQGEFDQFSFSQQDMSSINKAQSWGYGYNLGMLYQFTDVTRVGLTYRSQINETAKGTSYGYATGFPTYTSAISAVVHLPATTTLSAYHDINAAWTVLSTVNFTQWNSQQALTLKNVTVPSQASPTTDVTIPLNFRNTWNFAVGANYHVDAKSFLRLGAGYDESPTNDANRELRLPDSDRIIAAIGWHYQMLPTLGIDVGYNHIFALKAPINTNIETASIPAAEIGTVNSSGDMLGMQINWRFA